MIDVIVHGERLKELMKDTRKTSAYECGKVHYLLLSKWILRKIDMESRDNWEKGEGLPEKKIWIVWKCIRSHISLLTGWMKT